MLKPNDRAAIHKMNKHLEDVSPCTPKDYIGSEAQSELEGGYV